MKYTNEDGTPFTKKEFLQKLKTDKEFNNEFGRKGIDQISELIKELKKNPDSRRLLLSAWNISDLPYQILPPCHYGFQVYTRELGLLERNKIASEMPMRPHEVGHNSFDEFGIPKRAISLMWNQRSVDTPLGLPYNITSYGILTHILAKECNMVAEELICNLGDTHIYLNQTDGINEQLQNDVNKYSEAKILIKDFKNIFNLSSEDIEIIGYNSYPAIDIPLSN